LTNLLKSLAKVVPDDNYNFGSISLVIYSDRATVMLPSLVKPATNFRPSEQLTSQIAIELSD
jgi:hypothetical protein